MKYIKNSNHFEYKLNNSKIEITPSTNQIAYSFKGDKFKLTNISNNSYLFNDVKLFFTITFLYRDSVLFTIKGGGYILYFIQKDDDKNSLIIYDYYEEDKKDKNIVGNIQSKNLKNIKLDYPSFYKLNIYDAFKETINAILIATLIYYNKIYHYDDYPYTSTTNQSSSVTTTIKKINKENKDFKKEEKIKKEKKEKLKKKNMRKLNTIIKYFIYFKF